MARNIKRSIKVWLLGKRKEEKATGQTALSAIEVRAVILANPVWLLLANNKQGLKG
jgi:hypothetical protein